MAKDRTNSSKYNSGSLSYNKGKNKNDSRGSKRGNRQITKFNPSFTNLNIAKQSSNSLDWSLNNVKRSVPGKLALVSGPAHNSELGKLGTTTQMFPDGQLSGAVYNYDSNTPSMTNISVGFASGVAIIATRIGVSYTGAFKDGTTNLLETSAYTEGLAETANEIIFWLNNNYGSNIELLKVIYDTDKINKSSVLEAPCQFIFRYQSELMNAAIILNTIQSFLDNYKFLKARFPQLKANIDANYNALMSEGQVAARAQLRECIGTEFFDIHFWDTFIKPLIGINTIKEDYSEPITSTQPIVTDFMQLASNTTDFDSMFKIEGATSEDDTSIGETPSTALDLLRTYSIGDLIRNKIASGDLTKLQDYMVKFDNYIDTYYAPVKSALLMLGQSQTGIRYVLGSTPSVDTKIKNSQLSNELVRNFSIKNQTPVYVNNGLQVPCKLYKDGSVPVITAFADNMLYLPFDLSQSNNLDTQHKPVAAIYNMSCDGVATSTTVSPLYFYKFDGTPIANNTETSAWPVADIISSGIMKHVDYLQGELDPNATTPVNILLQNQEILQTFNVFFNGITAAVREYANNMAILPKVKQVSA